MKYASLALWIMTASFGTYLITTWIVSGGLRPHSGESRSKFDPILPFGHAALALTGLALWIAYIVTGARALALTCLGILGVVVILGSTMLGMWLRSGNARRVGLHEHRPRHAAEDHLPPPAVFAHGTLAITTVVLVLITALQAATAA